MSGSASLLSVSLDAAAMYSAIQQRDQAFNGQFVTGVLTTGIYCLPSCPARTPKFENIRFFKKPHEARDAGLRACLRCKPDDFYDNVDDDREIVLELARRLFHDPVRFRDTSSLIHASGLGATKLNALWRRHFHTTLKRSLSRARLVKAASILRRCGDSLDEVSAAVGFESLSTFHDQFRACFLMSPGAFRQIRAGEPYAIRLPDDFRLADTLRYLQRDADDPLQQWHGQTLIRSFSFGDQAGLAQLAFDAQTITVTPDVADDLLAELHDQVLRLLGLSLDPSPFERFAAKHPDGAALMGDAHGLRLPQTPTPFEALIWAILGQQINLAFAYKLRQRLIAHVDRRYKGRLVHPTAQQILALNEDDLKPLQFSHSKAAYIKEAAKALCEARLDLSYSDHVSAELLERQLIAVRGIGKWSAQYVLMRGFGFADCVPVGDAGTRQGLALLRGSDKPEHAEVDAFLDDFAPYRTFATAHLWRLAALAQSKKGTKV